MAGFLDQYDAGGDRRDKVRKTTALVAVAVLVVGGLLFFVFHNFRQERQVKHFFALLEAHDYKAAYALWGCTDANPCRDYPMTSFLRDWGPESGRGDVGNLRIARSRSCGSGVIITADFGRNQQEILWVQRGDLTIGFSPYPGCPAPR